GGPSDDRSGLCRPRPPPRPTPGQRRVGTAEHGRGGVYGSLRRAEARWFGVRTRLPRRGDAAPRTKGSGRPGGPPSIQNQPAPQNPEGGARGGRPAATPSPRDRTRHPRARGRDPPAPSARGSPEAGGRHGPVHHPGRVPDLTSAEGLIFARGSVVSHNPRG